MAKSKKGGKKSNKGSGEHNPQTEGGPDSVRGNIAALTAEIKTSNSLLESSADYSLSQTFALQNINNLLVDMYNDVHAIHELMVGNSLKQKEADAERQKMMEDLLKSLNKKPEKDKDQKKGDFSWLGLAAALVSGLVAGGIAFIKNYIKGLQVFWMSVAKALKVDGIIMSFLGKIKSGFTYIEELVSGGFNKALNFVKGLFKEMKWVESIREFFSGLGKWFAKITNLEGIVADLKGLWTAMTEAWAGLKKPFEWIGKIFGSGGGSILGWFTDIFAFMKPIITVFEKLGAVLGKLALPLQVIMSVFDTVTGALDGWEKTEGTFMDKLVGAIKGGLTGLLNGLIGGLLDLLKDGLSFILDFFGMKDAAAWLDSFSFTDMITKGISASIDAIVSLFKAVTESPIAVVKSIADSITSIDWSGMFKSALAAMVAGLLAPVNAISKWAGFDIVKKVQDMLGLSGGGGSSTQAPAQPSAPQAAPAAAEPPKVAEVVKAVKEEVKPQQPAAQLQAKEAEAPKVQETLQQAQDRLNKAEADGQMTRAEANVEKMKLGLRPSFGRANSGPSNMQAPAVPISSSTTKWDPEDMMARGMAM